MNKKELRGMAWYESLEYPKRKKLQLEFDLVYDEKGDRESKFYRWLSDNYKFKI